MPIKDLLFGFEVSCGDDLVGFIGRARLGV